MVPDLFSTRARGLQPGAEGVDSDISPERGKLGVLGQLVKRNRAGTSPRGCPAQP